MTPELFTLLALAAGALLGWFASLRWGRPPAPPAPQSPLSPAEVKALKEAFTSLFAQFIDNTTVVVGGLQEDINGLRDAVERVSAWAPGQELESPVQLTRWMGESSRDRAEIHRRLDLQARLIIGLYSLAPLIVVIFLRIVYVVLWGAS